MNWKRLLMLFVVLCGYIKIGVKNVYADDEIPNGFVLVTFDGEYEMLDEDGFGLAFPEGVITLGTGPIPEEYVKDLGYSARSKPNIMIGGVHGSYIGFDANTVGDVYSAGLFFSGKGGVLTAYSKTGVVLDVSEAPCCEVVFTHKLFVESVTQPIYVLVISPVNRGDIFVFDDLFFVPQSVSCIMDVPKYLQIDPLWKDDKYGANWWNERDGDRTIGYEGCALTSAAMVLSYYGGIQNGSNVNPDVLNDWLKNQPIGYVGGSVNWFAVQRYANEVMNINLHYRGRDRRDDDLLRNRLCSGEPMILELSGHFVVARGNVDRSWLINDPLDRSHVLSSNYGNWYKSTRRFSANATSRTREVSAYLIIASDADVVFSVTFPSGEVFEATGVGGIEVEMPEDGFYRVGFGDEVEPELANIYLAGEGYGSHVFSHTVEASLIAGFNFNSALNDPVEVLLKSKDVFLPYVVR